MQMTKRWDIFEIVLEGPAETESFNPFTDVELSAQFRYKNRVVEPEGFYDGEGVYRVRFMPDVAGEWRYVTRSNIDELEGHEGKFECVPATGQNHGPVGVHNTFHFAHADGTPYFECGTTCYAWAHQPAELQEQTLATMAESPFNKLRMCVFPKDYTFNKNEPPLYPYEGEPLKDWDFTRFNPAFWQSFEQRVGQLREMGIEADIILFHTYDRWGFEEMDAESDDRYLRYTVARLAAYRNVWWSLANEFDFMPAKSESDWDRFFRVIQESDPYGRLRGIHNGRDWYDHNKPWVTHASIQSHDVERVGEWRERYRKPIVIDECRYEGNVEHKWGNITAKEMVRLFWESGARGGYCGHGETYLHPEDILWWSKGGVLHGESPARIAFFREIMEADFEDGFDPLPSMDIMHGWAPFACVGRPGEFYLIYFGDCQIGRMPLKLPEGQYKVEIIDTWEMTITPMPGTFGGESVIELPAKPYIAIRIHKM